MAWVTGGDTFRGLCASDRDKYEEFSKRMYNDDQILIYTWFNVTVATFSFPFLFLLFQFVGGTLGGK